jgi:small-conductance mechanosensitive channel/CRP-like cAMP-binding protein
MLALTLLSSERLGWEAVTAGALTLLGVLAFVPLRHLVKRAKLISAYLVFTLSASVYLAVAFVDPGRLKNPADTVTWWLNRAVVGAMLFVLVRVIDRLLVIPMFSRGGTTQVPRFIHQVILMVLSIFVVLMYGKTAFGWPINDFLTGGAVISIVLGLALQESLGNLFSGLVLQAAPPFVLGDFIQAGNIEGRVVDMTWRAVTLHTQDDNYVVIPNGTIARQEIVNYHAPTTSTARMVKIGLDCDLPPCDAVAVLQRAAIETNGVQATPPPLIVMLDFAESAIIYGIKFWIAEPQRHLRVEHEVRMHAWYRVREKGYNIPFPVRTVEVINHHQKTKRERESHIAMREESFINIPLLEPLAPAQKRMLAEGASNVQLAPGQVLFEQDDAGDSLYVIRTGKADVLVRGPTGGTSVLATLGPGDVIGEMSALTGQPRSATIRAATALSLVQIDKRDFQRLVDSDASVLEKISTLIARRNAQRDQHLQGQTAAPEAQAISVQQQSLLDRMIRFFKA